MSDSQPRPTDLRPPDFVVTEDDPFGNDQLSREESVRSLCQVVANAAGPLVVSVEGAYGTGKSAFLRMCAAHLEGPEARTVEFNAWQQGHTGRPLIDLVAALAAELDNEDSWDSVKEAAKQIGWRAAAILSKGFIARNESADASVFDDWLDIESNVSKFKASLRAQIGALKGKLVIFVDELDRCEPNYALDLLNKAPAPLRRAQRCDCVRRESRRTWARRRDAVRGRLRRGRLPAPFRGPLSAAATTDQRGVGHLRLQYLRVARRAQQQRVAACQSHHS